MLCKDIESSSSYRRLTLGRLPGSMLNRFPSFTTFEEESILLGVVWEISLVVRVYLRTFFFGVWKGRKTAGSVPFRASKQDWGRTRRESSRRPDAALGALPT